MSTDNEPAEFQIDDTYSVPVNIHNIINYKYCILLSGL